MEETLATKDLVFRRGNVEFRMYQYRGYWNIRRDDIFESEDKFGSQCIAISFPSKVSVSAERREITLRYLELLKLGLDLKDMKMVGRYLSNSKPVSIEWNDKELMGFKNGQEY